MQIEGESSGQVALPGLWANLGQLGLWQFVGPEYIKFVLLYLLRLGCVKLTSWPVDVGKEKIVINNSYYRVERTPMNGSYVKESEHCKSTNLNLV